MFSRKLLILTPLVVLSFAIAAMGATPELRIVLPRGVQRGTEADIVLHGNRLDDAKQIVFYSPGITVEKLDAKNPTELHAHIRIAKDAHIGEYCVRVRTETGISELRTMYVGPFPIIEHKVRDEKGKPIVNDFDHPQPIDMNVTVAGTVENEQVHYFSVNAKKGQRLTAEAHGMRLGDMFDPYVAIVNEKRFELATSDDTALAMQDPIASTVIPADGRYIILIRESSYGGGGDAHYLLHVGTYPRPTMVYPLGGKAGEDLQVKFIGDVSGPFTKTIKLPDKPSDSLDLFPEQDGLTAPSPNHLRVSSFPNVLEQEPNNDVKSATAYTGDLPVAFNGIIDKPGDIDFFRFKAKKDQRLHIRVLARALRSPLDSVLVLYDGKGNGITSNDDSGTPDSYIQFNVPRDDEYVISVTDQLRQGGPDYAYRVEITPVKPNVTITIPQYQQNSQERWTAPVPRGNRYATLMRVTHEDMGGTLAVHAAGLPDGVTMQAPPIDGSDVIPVVFEAKADAPIAGALSELIANSPDKNNPGEGGYEQKVDLVYGPNNAPLYMTKVDKFAVAVTKEAPFKLHLEQPKVPLVQGGSMDLKVTAERASGFKGGISVRLLFNPPGIGAISAVDMPGDKSEISYPLNAEQNAGVRKWKICVVGESEVKGQLWVSSELVELTIAPPYLQGQLQMTAAEQGKPAVMLCKLEQKEKFEGKAKVKLLGLPSNVTAQDMEISSADQQVLFPLTVGEKAPPGNHGGLFCRVTVMKDGQEIVHNIAHGGVLRVDKPPEQKKSTAAPKQAVAKNNKPAPAARPLSRLEKLREEQAQK